MTLLVTQNRSALERTRSAIAEGRLTVGFLGGSITEPRVDHNWPERVLAHLAGKYPTVRLTVENAAIGATGSDSAVFRVDREIIQRKCDLVFVEYAVNDNDTDAIVRARSREGLLRKLLKSGSDVVIVYTFSPDMYAAMAAGRMPPSIADFEVLATHYNLPSVWMGLHALNQVNAGLLRWHEWLPDNLHPQYRGSQVYAECVNAYLDDALRVNPGMADRTARALPPAVDPLNWEYGTCASFYDAVVTGPWTIRRRGRYEWIEQSLETSAIGATIDLAFVGRVLWLGLDFGKRAADFRYRIDGVGWVEQQLDRPDWAGDSGWFRGILLTQDLTPGTHKVTIETTYNHSGCAFGTDFKIGLIGFLAS